ncbi:hypothetical protein F5888DRAFT_674512 [Russula emetica]|nr:hypothetical protein F5888DRAFT_674512 [Russula emetica]
MSQSAHQGLEDDRLLSTTSSNRPLQENSNSDDSSGRSSPYAEDLDRIIVLSSLMIVVCTIALDSRSVSVTYLRPDSVNPNVAYATTPLDSPVAEPPPFSLPIYAFWPILGRPFSLAMALISALFVGSSLRRPGDHPTQHDAWYQVILCLYFVALVKLLFDVDFGQFITTSWWIGFLSVSWNHFTRTMRNHPFLF